jgi:acetyl-CoA C-acetyltransferase
MTVQPQDAVVVAFARTPMGRYGGQLAAVRPDDLAATAIEGALRRAGLVGPEVEDVVLGCANQAGEDNRNVARMALLLAGMPVEVPGQTVNRLCGSGMQAIVSAARELQVGAAQVLLAGGVESMSRSPWVVPKPLGALPRGPQTIFDTALGWRLVNPRMQELYGTLQMGETAERVAEAYGVSRAAQDAFAVCSHQRALKAQHDGVLAREIVPVKVPQRRGDAILVEQDEGPRADASLETLARLRSCSCPAPRRSGASWCRSGGSSPPGRRACIPTTWGSGRCRRPGGRSPQPSLRSGT